MTDRRGRWPEVGRKAPNIHAHRANLVTEIQKLIEFSQPTEGKDGKAAPWRVVKPLYDSILDLCQKFDNEPTNGEISKVLQEIKERTNTLATEVRTIKYNTEQPAAAPVKHSPNGVASWASVAARNAVPPPSVRSKISSSTPIDLTPEHRALTVRVADKDAIEGFRAMNEPTKSISKLINNKIGKSNNAHIKQAIITAVRILRSGDIQLHAQTPAQAESLRIHRKDWQECLGRNAEVLVPTYGVVVHGVPIKSMTDNREAMLRKWEIENHSIIENHRIIDYHWLKKVRQGQREASLVLDFESPIGANAAIHAEALHWENSVKRTVKYDRTCQIKRCFRCYHYGHIGTQCQKDEVCGHCASRQHPTKECNSSAQTPTCALCQGPHKAWSTACPHYQKESERASAAREKTKQEKYWPEPVPISPGPSEISAQRSSTGRGPSQQTSQTTRSNNDKTQTAPTSYRGQKRVAIQSPTHQASQSPTKRNRSPTKASASNRQTPAIPDPFHSSNTPMEVDDEMIVGQNSEISSSAESSNAISSSTIGSTQSRRSTRSTGQIIEEPSTAQSVITGRS
jgi:hypothetical protein